MLRALLDEHPQLVVYPEETSFFRRFLPAATGKSLDEKLVLAERYLTHIFEWNLYTPPEHQAGFPDRDYTQFDAHQINQQMRSLVRKNYRHDGDILCGAVLAYGDVAGKLTGETIAWVEKTPYNEYFADQIFSWWEEAKCIHVVRDPRDNYLSYSRKHPEWSPETFALNWWKSTQAGVSNQKRYGKARYLILRYEDLVREPEKVVNEICGFLDIIDTPSLRQPSRAGVAWTGNSMFSDQFSAISPNAVGRWKRKLSSEQAAKIIWTALPWSTHFAYHDQGESNLSYLERWNINLKKMKYQYKRKVKG